MLDHKQKLDEATQYIEDVKKSVSFFLKSDVYDTILAALSTVREGLDDVEGWQDIETAPKDEVIIMCRYDGRVRQGKFVTKYNMWVETGGHGWGTTAATHWMPLPDGNTRAIKQRFIEKLEV